MRSRNIKPGFFENEIIAELAFETRLLFIGLWLLADREGRLEDRPRRIKAQLFAFDSFDIDSMLSDLQSKGFLHRYECDGVRYIQVTNFVKHQDPHYRERASQIPPPHGATNRIVATNVTRTQRQRILERDKYQCQLCQDTENLCIDHIIPVSRGGNSEDENLQVLCLPCNTSKGNKISNAEPNANQRRVEVESSNAPTVPLIPDSLIPDSLIPDSLIPDSGASRSQRSSKEEIPDWVSTQDWADYVEMRKRIRKPMTARAMRLAIADLDALRKQGHPPNLVLQQSIKNAWQGLFALKGQQPVNGGKSNVKTL
jgi:hypothetical protein